jgi:hypothetical protein
MIKLTRPAKPDYLIKNETQLTAEYIKSVDEKKLGERKDIKRDWNKHNIP